MSYPAAELSTSLGESRARRRPLVSYRFITRRVVPAVTVLLVGSLYLFLLAPILVVIAASFDGGDAVGGRAFLRFPPHSLSLQWYGAISAGLYHALWVSLSVGLLASLLATLLGVPAAIGLVRGRVPGKALIGAMFRAPLQIPFIVIGVAFLQTYYLLGDLLGLHLVGTYAGLVLGHLFVALPYVVGSVGAVLQRFNPSFEEAALSLGASRWSTFRRITLPLIMPGIYSGALFGFMVSFGDVPISLFLAGPGFTPLPVEIFHSMEFDFDAAILALSSLIVVGSVLLLWLIQKLIGLDVLLQSNGRN